MRGGGPRARSIFYAFIPCHRQSWAFKYQAYIENEIYIGQVSKSQTAVCYFYRIVQMLVKRGHLLSAVTVETNIMLLPRMPIITVPK